MKRDEMYTASWGKIADLLTEGRELAELLSQAEQNHGGLIGVDTLSAANRLRLQLARWPKVKIEAQPLTADKSQA